MIAFPIAITIGWLSHCLYQASKDINETSVDALAGIGCLIALIRIGITSIPILVMWCIYFALN